MSRLLDDPPLHLELRQGLAYGATELDVMHALEPETKTDFSVTQATFTTPVDTATVGTSTEAVEPSLKTTCPLAFT